MLITGGYNSEMYAARTFHRLKSAGQPARNGEYYE